MNRGLLASAAIALLGAVALVLVPYDRGLEATGRNGVDVDIDISVSCAAPIIGAFESGDVGWFNYSSDNAVAGGGLCRTSARWRLGGALVLLIGGSALLRRGLISDRGRAVERERRGRL